MSGSKRQRVITRLQDSPARRRVGLLAVVVLLAAGGTAAAGVQAQEAAVGAVEVTDLQIAAEQPRSGYDRDLFDHWTDADGDGCDTRDEVLIAESLTTVTVSEPDCSLSGGQWRSRYDGVETTDSSSFDVDHLVPLAEAWDSGADAWGADRRQEFANDLGHVDALIAVTASTNRSKGDQDPSE